MIDKITLVELFNGENMKYLGFIFLILSLGSFAQEASKESCKKQGLKFNKKSKSCEMSKKDKKLIKDKLILKSLGCKKAIPLNKNVVSSLKNYINTRKETHAGGIHGEKAAVFKRAANGTGAYLIEGKRQVFRIQVMDQAEGKSDLSDEKTVMISEKALFFNHKDGSLDQQVIRNLISGSAISTKYSELKELNDRKEKARPMVEYLEDPKSITGKCYYTLKGHKLVKSKNTLAKASKRDKKLRKKHPGELTGGR